MSVPLARQNGAAAAAHLPRHEARDNYRSRLRNRREEAKTGQRSSEECQRNAAKKGRNRWVSDIPPCQMARVVQCCQFIAMEAIAAADDQMNDDRRCRQVT